LPILMLPYTKRIKLQLCPSIVVLSYKQGERERRCVKKKEQYKIN
jgi:hypothetical protein